MKITKYEFRTQIPTIRRGQDKVDEDYIFKFMDNFICKPLKSGIEDIIQCQSNLQDMYLRSQKKIKRFRVKDGQRKCK